MGRSTKLLLFWSPRVLGILFVAFLSTFALDVFDRHTIWWKAILALFLHLAPAIFLLLVLLAAWKREWIGAVAYILFAALYAGYAGRHHWDWALVISGPPLITGILFLASWLRGTKLRSAS